MRRRGRVDENHQQIVKAMRAIGASVVSMADLGGSVPDLLVGYRGVNYIMEVKRPALKDHAPVNQRERDRLARQDEWAAKWRGGTVHRVYTVEDALNALEGR